MALRCSLFYLLNTPAKLVLLANMFQKITARHKVSLSVRKVSILERGHRLLACGETVVLNRSKKQEPIEPDSVSV